jgi:hypothetical protein
MSSTAEITKRARFLRNAAPQQFADFLTEFLAYTAHQYEVMVQTTAEKLHNAQGHAQQCKAIVDALERAKNG